MVNAISCSFLVNDNFVSGDINIDNKFMCMKLEVLIGLVICCNFMFIICLGIVGEGYYDEND